MRKIELNEKWEKKNYLKFLRLTISWRRWWMLLLLSDAFFDVRCSGKNHDWPCCCLHMIKSTTACGDENKYFTCLFGILKNRIRLRKVEMTFLSWFKSTVKKELREKRAERGQNWYCHKINLPSANIASRYLHSDKAIVDACLRAEKTLPCQ